MVVLNAGLTYQGLQESHVSLQNPALTNEEFEDESSRFFAWLDKADEYMNMYTDTVVKNIERFQEEVERITDSRLRQQVQEEVDQITDDIQIHEIPTTVEHFETDTTQAKQQNTFVTGVDQVVLEHIIDYYYQCQNSLPHAFKMKTILDYCAVSEEGARNYKNCPVCNAEMDFQLYKQPPELSRIYETLFENVLVKDEDDNYDIERIEYIDRLVFLLNKLGNKSLGNVVEMTEMKVMRE